LKEPSKSETQNAGRPAGYCWNAKPTVGKWPPKTGSRLLSRPATLATRLPQLVFEVADLLLQLDDFLLLRCDLGVFFHYILAGVLFAERFLRVCKVLHLRLLSLALQDVQFFLRQGQLVARFLEALPPCLFVVLVRSAAQ